MLSKTKVVTAVHTLFFSLQNWLFKWPVIVFSFPVLLKNQTLARKQDCVFATL